VYNKTNHSSIERQVAPKAIIQRDMSWLRAYWWAWVCETTLLLCAFPLCVIRGIEWLNRAI